MAELKKLPKTPGVTYVMPVLNEEKYLENAVAAVLSQEYAGESELILSLGVSSDATDEIAQTLADRFQQVRLVRNDRNQIPAGVNLGIKAAKHPVVIRVDAHAVLPEDYTATAVDTLVRTGAANLGGRMLAQGDGRFQSAVARAYNSPFGTGGGVYHHGESETEADSAYLGVFRKEVLAEVGYFDETLLRAEDWELNSRIRAAGYRVLFVPKLQVVYWPRDNWQALRKQMYATGVWRGALVRRQGNTPLRYVAPPAVAGLVGSCLALWSLQRIGLFRGRFFRLLGKLMELGSWIYFLGVGFVGATKLPSADALDKALNTLVLVTMHLSWGAGFLKGFLQGAQLEKDVDRSRL
ncbi:MAG: glycosyltransferase family 2 protein [Propionibacteriaceae bacterium]|nr:glycosyltransferase family 2 protein [Propionibacteriaceae bacterium]